MAFDRSMRCGAALVVALFVGADLLGDEFVHPLDAVVSKDGTVFVVDRRLPGVWRSTDDGFETFVVGEKRYRERMNAVRCVALDAEGQLLVGDSATREVYRIDAKGNATGLTAKPPKPGAIGIPNSIAVDSKGVIHVADLESQRIWRIPAEGGKPTEFAVVQGPRGLAFDEKDRLWVVSHGNDQVLRFSPEGEAEVVLSGRPFRFPNEIDVVGEAAYVSDGYGKAIYQVRVGEKPKAIHTGEPLANPVGVVGHDAGLLVVDSRKKQLFQLSLDGKIEPFPVQAADAADAKETGTPPSTPR